jgi:hypothetical protein
MERIVKNREELEAILLGFLRSRANCGEALKVVVERVNTPLNGANWTVTAFDPGSASADACDHAMQLIVPLVQEHFDLADSEGDPSPGAVDMTAG